MTFFQFFLRIKLLISNPVLHSNLNLGIILIQPVCIQKKVIFCLKNKFQLLVLSVLQISKFNRKIIKYIPIYNLDFIL